MRARDKKAHDFGIVLRQYFANRKEVIQRLRHLLIVDLYVAVVHPVIDEGLSGRSFALRNLVLVVRKLQVLTAAVNVEMLAEQRAAHRRAFDMPAGAAAPVLRLPAGV